MRSVAPGTTISANNVETSLPSLNKKNTIKRRTLRSSVNIVKSNSASVSLRVMKRVVHSSLSLASTASRLLNSKTMKNIRVIVGPKLGNVSCAIETCA